MNGIYQCIHTTYTVHICSTGPFSTSGIVIHYIQLGCQPPNPRNYTALNGNYAFDSCDVFQECNPGVKQGMSVVHLVFNQRNSNIFFNKHTQKIRVFI